MTSSAFMPAIWRFRQAEGSGPPRAIARAYSVFAMGGRELGLRPETLQLLAAPAIPPSRGFRDACLHGEVRFSLGFMKPSPLWPFGRPGSFGAPGAGGSLGYADPEAGIAYAYVTNQMGTALTGTRAMWRCEKRCRRANRRPWRFAGGSCRARLRGH